MQTSRWCIHIGNLGLGEKIKHLPCSACFSSPWNKNNVLKGAHAPMRKNGMFVVVRGFFPLPLHHR